MNPLETIENDKMLQSILNGLTGMWHFPEEFLAIIVYHTRDFDVANATVECFADEDIHLEEALYQAMEIDDFNKYCLNSKYLNRDNIDKAMKKYE